MWVASISDESARVIPSWQRVAIIGAAVPAFLFFPLGLAMLTMTGQQLVFGFDDQPIGAMLLGFGLGFVVVLAAFVFVCGRIWKGAIRIPVIIITIAAVIDLFAVPVARWITQRVEHPERYSVNAPSVKP
ncbi:MAG: hypothetical protein AB1813_19745 [Verrucomicrobiota bacterium]